MLYGVEAYELRNVEPLNAVVETLKVGVAQLTLNDALDELY